MVQTHLVIVKSPIEYFTDVSFLVGGIYIDLFVQVGKVRKFVQIAASNCDDLGVHLLHDLVIK